MTVAACLAFSNSDRPRHLATTADAPIPSPIARLMTVKVTGNVKLIAVRDSVPRKLMNQVSTRLNVNNISMPIIIGVVMRMRDFSIDPSTRL